MSTDTTTAPAPAVAAFAAAPATPPRRSFARAGAARKALGISVLAACFALAQWGGWIADVVFGHLHNLIAVGLWWAWRRRPSRLHWLPLALFAAGTALLLGGAADLADRPAGAGRKLAGDVLP